MRPVVIEYSSVVGIGERIVPHFQACLDKLGFSYDASRDILTAPDGWTIIPLGFDSGVIERDGIERGGWGGESPTRAIRLELLKRHEVVQEQPTNFDGYIWYKSMVKDRLTGEVISPVFSCKALDMRSLNPEASREHHKAANDAYTWLMENFPDARDPTAYWDD